MAASRRKWGWWRSPKPLVFAACLLPLAWLMWQVKTDNLGANAAQALVQLLGLWAFRFLLLALAITPARRITGWNGLARYRRMIGLFAFFYVTLHFISYIVLDQSLDLDAIIHDILKRPFIAVGFAAFLLLIPLAATSFKAAIRKLGKNWQRLHKAVYVVGVLAAIHYVMLVKSWPAQPLVYAGLVGALLGIRLLWWVLKNRNSLPRPQTVQSPPLHDGSAERRMKREPGDNPGLPSQL